MTSAIAVGIDMATAGARLCALDIESGQELVSVSAALPAVRGLAGGRREQDPEYGRIAVELLDRAAAQLGPRAPQVAALSVTATSGTVVPVDAHGVPVGSAVMYDDRRAHQGGGLSDRVPVDRPIDMLERMAVLRGATGASAFASVADVVVAALAGTRLPSDTSHFLKAGIDPEAGRWPSAVARLGLDERMLPPLVRPGTVLGSASAGGALASAVLVAGMTDGCTSQLATGAVIAGSTVGVLGTTLVLKAVSREDLRIGRSGVYAHVAPDGLFWVGGASNVGGGSVREGTGGGGLVELDGAAWTSGPASVVRYPLVRIGERFPVADPAMSAFTVDLAGRTVPEPTDPVARHRATLEGVAFVERNALEKLAEAGAGGGMHALSGGGSSSPIWNTIRASALGREVRVPAHRESAYGAAVLAAWALRGGDFAGHVARYAGRDRMVAPDVTLMSELDERYEVFRTALAERTAR